MLQSKTSNMIPTTRTTTTPAAVTTQRFFRTDHDPTSEPAYEGVSQEVSKLISNHAHQQQTPVSLQTLLQTGRGEFLHKTYKQLDDDDHRGATAKVLIQVRDRGNDTL